MIRTISILVCMCLLSACDKKGQEKDKNDLNKIISETIPDGGEANTTIGKCLMEKDMREILTPDLVQEFLGVPVSKAKEEEIEKTSFVNKLEYTDEDNPRGTKKVELMKGLIQDFPVENVIGISYIRTTDLPTFKNFYRNATDEDLAKMEKAMNSPETKKKQQEMLDKQNLSPEMRKVVEESLNAGKDKDIARGLSAGAKERFEEASGVGEYCIWNKQEQMLLVYTSNVQIGVSVNTSDDKASNKAKATELAKKILAKCQ